MNISAVSYAMSAPKKVAFGNQQSYTPAGFSAPVTPEQLKDGLLKDIKQVVKPEQGKTQLTPEQQQIIDIVVRCYRFLIRRIEPRSRSEIFPAKL